MYNQKTDKCITCKHYIPFSHKCREHDQTVHDDMTCGLYREMENAVKEEPLTDLSATSFGATPKELLDYADTNEFLQKELDMWYNNARYWRDKWFEKCQEVDELYKKLQEPDGESVMLPGNIKATVKQAEVLAKEMDEFVRKTGGLFGKGECK